MKYRVKEIFYPLQGEGANVGRPAVFFAAPATLDWMLDAIEVLAFHRCPDPVARVGLLRVIGTQFYYQRTRLCRSAVAARYIPVKRPRSDSNRRITDLQSVPLVHLGTRPYVLST